MQPEKRHLRLYARSTSLLGKVVISDSMDNGVTWTEGKPLDVGLDWGGDVRRTAQAVAEAVGPVCRTPVDVVVEDVRGPGDARA